MLGPVFNAEMLRAGRRGRAHVLRWIYAGWLCLQLLYAFDATHVPSNYGAPRPNPTKAAVEFGRLYRDLILRQQFLLIVLVTPAFVAGAVTDEKTRGTLQGLLTAYVTPADVVLGKLFARTAQVGVLALAPLPLLALVSQYSGVTPEFLLALVAVTGLILFGLGGVSMLASVWLRQTRSAVVATYVGLFVGWWGWRFLTGYGWLPAAWADYFSVIRVLDPLVNRDAPAEAVRRFGQAAAVWGGLGLVTTAIAVWRLRPAYLRQMEARPRRAMFRGLTSRPRPVRDVVAWKECYVGRRAPLWIGVPLTAGLGAGIVFYALAGRVSPAWSGAIPYTLIDVGVYATLSLTLIVGVRCSGCITGERERHTWDGLMTSPLTVREIVRGKHRGVLRATWPYLLAAWFGAAAIAGLATHHDPVVLAGIAFFALGVGGLVLKFAPRAAWWVVILLLLLTAGTGGLAATLVVGLALIVTYLAMYFLGAVGLFCSAYSTSSWRSLLGTVVLGYASGSALFCVGLPIGCVGSAILGMIAEIVERAFRSNPDRATFIFGSLQEVWPLTLALGSGFLLWLVARSFLTTAENIIAKRDRIPPEWVRMIEYDMPRHGPYGSRSRSRR